MRTGCQPAWLCWSLARNVHPTLFIVAHALTIAVASTAVNFIPHEGIQQLKASSTKCLVLSAAAIKRRGHTHCHAAGPGRMSRWCWSKRAASGSQHKKEPSSSWPVAARPTTLCQRQRRRLIGGVLTACQDFRCRLCQVCIGAQHTAAHEVEGAACRPEGEGQEQSGKIGQGQDWPLAGL